MCRRQGCRLHSNEARSSQRSRSRPLSDAPDDPFYEAEDDPYCYKGSTVLKNVARLRDQAELDQFEAAVVTFQSTQPLPEGALDAAHYRAIHRHLFGSVYTWAGKVRTVVIAKRGSVFCMPAHIDRQLDSVFRDLASANYLRGLNAEAFAAGAAHVLSELNAVHPFREGNGRAQKAFLILLAERAGHSIDIGRIHRQAYIDAMVDAFNDDEAPLAALILGLL